MQVFEILLIAVGLAMDAFAVSVANGVVLKDVRASDGLIFGLYFGCFQMIMPVLGWLLGRTFANQVSDIAHWVAAILLVFIGINMIVQAIKNDEKHRPLRRSDILNSRNMVMLAIATSIDALAVGVSLAVISAGIYISALTFGIVAFLMSFVGVLLGKKLKRIIKGGAEITGGVILIIIGIKIIIEHLFF